MSALKLPHELFAEQGYYYTAPMFDETHLVRIRAHFDAVLAGEYDLGTTPHGVNRFGDAMVKVSNAWWADSVIREVVLSPRIARIAAQLLQVDELYLWADSLYWKAPESAGEQSQIGWHQDKQYWQTSSTDQMITACVALYPADELSGGMRFAEGSHKWGLVGGADALVGEANTGIHVTPSVPTGQKWEQVCPHLVPGQVTFHHALTFHASGPNLRQDPRRSITIHMVSGEGRLVNWEPTEDGHLSTVGLGNLFRGPLFPRLYP